MSHSKPRQISVAGSITNWPGVTPFFIRVCPCSPVALAARAVGVTVTSASTTRIAFIGGPPEAAGQTSPRSPRVPASANERQASEPRERSARRSGARESVSGSPRGEAPRLRLVELEPDVRVRGHAVQIVRLERDRAGADLPAGRVVSAGPFGWLRPPDDLLPLQRDRDRVSLTLDLHRDPLVVFSRNVRQIDDVIEAAGADAIAVAVIDLDFEALPRKSLRLEFGHDVDAAVRPIAREDVEPQIEILERMVADRAVVEEGRRLAHGVGDDGPVLDFE